MLRASCESSSLSPSVNKFKNKIGDSYKLSKKTLVLDTNVLINDPLALYSFEENSIVLPIEVIEELDKLKSEQHSSRSRSAREVGRVLDKLIKGKDVSKGIALPSGGTLFIPILPEVQKIRGLKENKKDNTIILTALEMKKISSNVIFISNDINARIKAASLGLVTEEYKHQKIELNDQFRGWQKIESSQEQLWELQDMGSIEIEGSFYENEYCFLSCQETSTIVIGRYDAELECLRHIPSTLEKDVSGVQALNIEQRIALDALLDPKINLVTITGQAGSGKTLLAIATALELTLQQKKYSKILVSRPVIPLGSDIGYLPGSIEDKLNPYMAPIYDNLEYITERAHKQNLKSVEQLKKNGVLEIEALTFIRGRSLPKLFMIIDEAQNLTPHEVKTIVSRAGEDTCMVFLGDVEQVDAPYLDSTTNGLVTLVEAFKEEKIAAHIHLTKTERSELAEKAVKLL